jgi:DNA processing protein
MMANTLSAEQQATLRLARSQGIGPVKFHALLEKFGSAVQAVNELRRQGKVTLASDAALETELKAAQRLGATHIFWGDENYPTLLKHIADPPVVLTCLGNIGLLQSRQIAVVGTRTASAIGQKFTRDLAQQLAQKGYTVTSGMARGIDANAHQGALQAGGNTIAVLGGGVDHIYPPEHEDLYRKIASAGCIVSEEAIGGEVAKHNFLRRNRIISGMSLAVVVAEGAERSGSMVTARLALEQGREIFAVPGHPTEPRASGPNKMIEAGEARLLTSAQALLETISQLPSLQQFSPKVFTPRREAPQAELANFDEAEPAPTLSEGGLLSLLSTNAVTVDELLRISGLEETTLASALTELELAGAIKRLPGGRVARAE